MSSQYGERGPLTAEIGSGVWGTPANFNGFRVSASLFSRFDQQHSTEGATYIRLGGHCPHSSFARFVMTLYCLRADDGVQRKHGIDARQSAVQAVVYRLSAAMRRRR